MNLSKILRVHCEKVHNFTSRVMESVCAREWSFDLMDALLFESVSKREAWCWRMLRHALYVLSPMPLQHTHTATREEQIRRRKKKNLSSIITYTHRQPFLRKEKRSVKILLMMPRTVLNTNQEPKRAGIFLKWHRVHTDEERNTTSICTSWLLLLLVMVFFRYFRLLLNRRKIDELKTGLVAWRGMSLSTYSA